MIVTLLLQEKRKSIYDLRLDNCYHRSANLSIKNIEDQQVNGIRHIIHYMPGFCFIDERVNAQETDSIDFRVMGEHYMVTLFYRESCQIKDYSNGTISTAQAGTIKWAHSVETHWKISILPSNQAHRFYFIMSAQYLEELLKNEIWRLKATIFPRVSAGHQSCDKEGYGFIDLPVKNILYELSMANYDYNYKRSFLELKLKELLFLLQTQDESRNLDNDLPPVIYQKLVMAKAFLLSNYVEPPTIGQLSRIVSLNEFKLKLHFKALFGSTIHNFIVKLKMEAAGKMLLENCSVNDMSARTGYRNVSHFIEVFKKYYGKTPKQATKGFQVPNFDNTYAG